MNKENTKAIELVNQYVLFVPIEFGGMDKELAKQCAINLVHNILLEHQMFPYNTIFYERQEFWKKVLLEIEKL